MTAARSGACQADMTAAEIKRLSAGNDCTENFYPQLIRIANPRPDRAHRSNKTVRPTYKNLNAPSQSEYSNQKLLTFLLINDLFLNPCRFAFAFTQIIELRASYQSQPFNVDLGDKRAVDGEDSFNAESSA